MQRGVCAKLRSLWDARAPSNPMNDNRYDNLAYSWPLGRWQFQPPPVQPAPLCMPPVAAPLPSSRGTKRGMAESCVEDGHQAKKIKHMAMRIVGKLFDHDEEPRPTKAIQCVSM